MSFFGMHTTMPCFCCSMIQTSKNIWLNVARMSPLMLSQLTLKIPYRCDLSEALLQAALLTAAFSLSSVLGVPSESFHSSCKFLCPAFSIREKRIIHLNRIKFNSQEINTVLQNSLVVACVITSFSVTLVFIHEKGRFRNGRRWEKDGIST